MSVADAAPGAQWCSHWGPTSHVCMTALLVLMLSFSHRSPVNWSSEVLGCRAQCLQCSSQCLHITQGVPLLPLSPLRCILTNCRQHRNFWTPQLGEAKAMGLLWRLWSLPWAFAVHTWNENYPECQTDKHSLIHSASVVNCTTFCEPACIINCRAKNMRTVVLSQEVPRFFIPVCGGTVAWCRGAPQCMRGMRSAGGV